VSTVGPIQVDTLTSQSIARLPGLCPPRPHCPARGRHGRATDTQCLVASVIFGQTDCGGGAGAFSRPLATSHTNESRIASSEV